jgi:hypothetical protein
MVEVRKPEGIPTIITSARMTTMAATAAPMNFSALMWTFPGKR